MHDFLSGWRDLGWILSAQHSLVREGKDGSLKAEGKEAQAEE